MSTPGSIRVAEVSAPPRARSSFADALRLNVRATLGRGYVRVVGSLREPAWIVTDAVLPSLGMSAFVLLYRALDAPPAFETLAVLGGILSTYWINVLWGMGAQLYWEKQQGQLQLYFVAPCSRMSILTGMAVGGMLMTTVRSLFGIAFGFGVLGVRVPPFDLVALIGVFLIAMTALYALGMVLASLFLLWGREAWHLANAFQEPVYFLSGMYFPLRTLGALAPIVAGLVPLALGIDAMRQVLLGDQARPFLSLRAEVLALAALSVAFLLLARVSLSYLERLSKREGRLTQRHQ